MRFRPEPLAPPAPNTRTAPSTAILWCNLGSPDAPTAGAVRRYLAQFLSDPRVVEIPAPLWRPILHGIILRTRPARSAAKYASIWTAQGSPLKVWTAHQAAMLRNRLAEQGHTVRVLDAMRYGQPAIGAFLGLHSRKPACVEIVAQLGLEPLRDSVPALFELDPCRIRHHT